MQHRRSPRVKCGVAERAVGEGMIQGGGENELELPEGLSCTRVSKTGGRE